MQIIRKHATAKLTNYGLSIRGTDTDQLGDILADALLLVPKHIKGVGFVSYSVYLQAKEIYDRHIEDLKKKDYIVLSGHSLGAGICRILAIMLLQDNMKVSVTCVGGVKALSRKAERWLAPRLTTDSWVVNYRDPVPHIGWWTVPEAVEYRGELKRHIFDWSMKAHMDYWS